MSNKVIGLVSMILVGLLACAPSVSDEEESGSEYHLESSDSESAMKSSDSESAIKVSEVASEFKGRIVYASQGALTEEGARLGIKKWTVVAIGEDKAPSQILALASNDTDVIYLLSLRPGRDFLQFASRYKKEWNWWYFGERPSIAFELVKEVQLLGNTRPPCDHDLIKFGTLLVFQKFLARCIAVVENIKGMTSAESKSIGVLQVGMLKSDLDHLWKDAFQSCY